MARVKFDLDVDDGYPPVSSELIYADILSDSRVKLANTPFFVEGVALGDVVECLKHTDDTFEYMSVIEESGNKSLSVIFIDSSIEESLYQRVKSMGHYCEYGEFPEYSMLAISVENDRSINELVDLLSSMEDQGKISYAELCI